MDSRPSLSGRFNVEAATTSSTTTSSSSSVSLSRDTSIARTNSSSFSKSLFDHNLSSILNNPHSSRSGDASWLGWWPSSASVTLPEFAPINAFRPELDANRSDFQPYLASISEHYSRFEDIRNHSSKEDVENIGGQGEALVACLREVPALYFKEDFELEDGVTFKVACPFSTTSDNLVLQERLSQYLDVVEMHLVKEISLRSNSFFEAQQQLGGLNVKIVEGCKRIRELKETISLLDVDIVGSARQIQELSSMRNNLLALQQKLRLILYVNQALSALKLLVSSADCAGALDVADDLKHLLDGDKLTGLHCFRHLRDNVAASMDSINSILSAEFLRASLHDAGDLDAVIVSRAKERASTMSNGRLDDVKLDEEETSNFRDRLLPIVIGLLRTAKLPSVLRVYRDTLTADMKTAIKTAVAELLPALVARPQESDFSTGERTVDADGGGSSLASRLRSLSSESFVQLLAAIFKIVLAHLVRAAEVKKSIEWTMSNLDGHYAAESVAAAIAHGAAVAETVQDSDGQVSHVVSYQSNATKVPILQGKANEATSPSNMSKNFRADVLRENTESVCAACDAAHGRWAKLLGVRAVLHPKLRLQEFISICSITQEFISATEKIGGRLGYSIRGVLQSQAKAFVDYQHESRVTKIKAVLDQETWSEVDVPDEFQSIVASMLSSDPIAGDSRGFQGSEIMASNGETTAVDTKEANVEQPVEQTDSRNVSNDAATQENSQHAGEANDVNKTNAVTSSYNSRNNNIKDRGKATSQTLMYRGAGYHMVNCGLILLKMLSEYIDMNDSLPTLSAEVVHRVVEILKFFNTRTCQLVLGAGAMQARDDADVVQHPISTQYDGTHILPGTGWSVSGSSINIVVDLGQIYSSIIQHIVPGPIKVVGQLETTGANPHIIRSKVEQQGHFSPSSSGAGLSGNRSKVMGSNRTGQNQLISSVHESSSRAVQNSSREREGSLSRVNSSSHKRIGSMPSKKAVSMFNLQHVVFGTIEDGTREEEAGAHSEDRALPFMRRKWILVRIRACCWMSFDNSRMSMRVGRISPMFLVPRLWICKMFLFSRPGWETFFAVGPSYW